MNIWEKGGFLKNGNEHPQSLRGVIFARSNGAIIEIPFSYDEVASRFDEVVGIIPLEHTVPTKTLYTTQYWKVFTIGGAVRLQSGETMDIVAVEPDIDSGAAFYSKKAVKGLRLTLKGGKTYAQ